MKTWFIRANGSTKHNQPGTSLYVPGEPPLYPVTKMVYKGYCLKKGIARIGWPQAGDLRTPGWQERAITAYGSRMTDHKLKYLAQFLEIKIGDLAIMPTYEERFSIHIGKVISPRLESNWSKYSPYYYYVNIESEDFFELSQRVDVDWVRGHGGAPTKFFVPAIGGTWRRAFGEIISARDEIIRLYNKSIS